jgi:hypothetical protein
MKNLFDLDFFDVHLIALKKMSMFALAERADFTILDSIVSLAAVLTDSDGFDGNDLKFRASHDLAF